MTFTAALISAARAQPTNWKWPERTYRKCARKVRSLGLLYLFQI